MLETIPLSITPDAAQYIGNMGLQEPYRKIVDGIPLRVPGVHAIAVSLQQPYELGGGPRIILDVTRDSATAGSDPTEQNWARWLIETWPPEIWGNFCLLTNYT